MTTEDYFNPVELEKRETDYSNPHLFCRNLVIHTPGRPIKSFRNVKVALIGVDNFLTSSSVGSTNAPDLIRTELYELYKIKMPGGMRIADLGNLKTGHSSRDVYYALRDVLLHLYEHGILSIVFGASEDIAYASLLCHEAMKQTFNFTTVQRRLAFTGGTPDEPTPENYLDFFLSSPYLFFYANIAQQACFVSSDQMDYLESHGHDSLRLGSIRYNTFRAEPYLRDAHVAGFDINAVKHADAPGQVHVSPNGLLAEDFCQLTRYAGMSAGIKTIFLTGYYPPADMQGTTARLAAQAIWYLLDGMTVYREEQPGKKKHHIQQYIIHHKMLDYDFVFYKSQSTGRWWVEVPVTGGKENLLIACSEEDYHAVCNEEIPGRWWKIHQKMNG